MIATFGGTQYRISQWRSRWSVARWCKCESCPDGHWDPIGEFVHYTEALAFAKGQS